MSIRDALDDPAQRAHQRLALERAVLAACRSVYGPRLLSLAVFGSAGRGTSRPDSDLDLFLVVNGLPDGRRARVDEFVAVESAVAAALPAADSAHPHPQLSPVFKTPAELALGSPLMFDMVEDARILEDHGGLLAAALDRLRRRLAELGARRIWRGDAWFWDLKPDYRPGEVFEI